MSSDFNYRTASRQAIVARAGELVGLSLSEVEQQALVGMRLAENSKGAVGQIVQAYFGMPLDSRRAPDFPAAGIELKVVPLVGRKDGTFRTKERTFISIIDYGRLDSETWDVASVRSKLAVVLLVFYRWDPEIRRPSVVVDRVLLWEPTSDEMDLFQHDWAVVWSKVRRGVAQDISEADGRVLGASTKGADRNSLRSQPYSSIRAMQRAWALKPPFTQALYESAARQRVATASPVEPDDFNAFESDTLKRLRPYLGSDVGSVAVRIGMTPSGAKDFHARVVERLIGAMRRKTEPDEFSRFGVENKVTRVSPRGRPYEAMSFPAFDYYDIVDEEWEDSDLLRRVSRLLIVPLVAPLKSTPLPEAIIGRAFFWSPSAAEVELIRREWDMFRGEIKAGRSHRFTPASQTIAIHVRPHGRDRTDTRDAPGVGPVTKKSFWLNISFVEQIIRESPGWMESTR